jgi:hypothetical protein
MNLKTHCKSGIASREGLNDLAEHCGIIHGILYCMVILEAGKLKFSFAQKNVLCFFLRNMTESSETGCNSQWDLRYSYIRSLCGGPFDRLKYQIRHHADDE